MTGALLIVAAMFVIARRSEYGGVTMRDAEKGTMGVTNSNLPRGIRNNNPGNIEKRDPWRGLAADQSGDSRFAIFTAPEWGIRAMAVILRNYQTRHGLNTIRAIVSRWAPHGENDPDQYARAVAAQAGVSPDQPIDVAAYLPRIIPAMIYFENGQQPYSQSLIQRGIDLA